MIQRSALLGERSFARVGLGTNRLRNTEENRAFLQAAADAGLGLIDTAHLYAGGQSESTVGHALAPFGDRVTVATKGGYEPGTTLAGLRAELEQSFERLRTDSIHLFYLHRAHPGLPIEESMRLLAEYRDAGRIEHVGLSAVSVEQIERAREIVPIAAVQNEYNLEQRGSDDVIDHCEREGILFVPYYPLHVGPAGLDEIAERHGASRSQIVLAWLLHRSPVILPIPGTLSIEHLRENLAALDIELADEEFDALSAG